MTAFMNFYYYSNETLTSDTNTDARRDRQTDRDEEMEMGTDLQTDSMYFGNLGCCNISLCVRADASGFGNSALASHLK